MINQINIGNISIGGANSPLVLIAGPCVIESYNHSLKIAKRIKEISSRLNIPFIFKASFDKANRSSIKSYRGTGIDEGLSILKEIKKQLEIAILSDIHEVWQADYAVDILDIIQIPALLCRQTDLVVAAAKSGLPINIKKGQFISPYEVENIISKAVSVGNNQVMITERGTCFGYNNLVVDFKSLPIIRGFGCPVIFDATHSVQLPGGKGECSGGQSQFAVPLIKAAVAVGCDGLFIEVHDNPNEALCDGPNMIALDKLESILAQALEIYRVVKKSNGL